MSRNFVLGVSVSVFLLGVIFWISYPKANNGGQPYPSPASGQVALAADHKSFDFGTISMARGKVNHTFAFKNTGNQPVLLTKFYTSCMCTSANIELNGRTFGPYGMVGMAVDTLNETLQPGAEAKVTIVFDPAAHGPAGVGTISREITVENNSGNPFVFDFTANVTP